MRDTYAFDVDGVIVDVSERLRRAKELSRNKKEFWELFFSDELHELDKPRPAGVEAVRDRARRGYVIIVTGRPQKLFKVTLKQVVEFTGVKPAYIYMRRTGDMRPSATIKLELLERAMNEGFNIVEYHDDEEEVLKNIMNTYPNITLYLHYNDSYRVFFKPLGNANYP